jgi:hypothetical protein
MVRPGEVTETLAPHRSWGNSKMPISTTHYAGHDEEKTDKNARHPQDIDEHPQATMTRLVSSATRCSEMSVSADTLVFVSADTLVFDAERDPDKELRLQLEATTRLTDEAKQLVKRFINGLLLSHEANASPHGVLGVRRTQGRHSLSAIVPSIVTALPPKENVNCDSHTIRASPLNHVYRERNVWCLSRLRFHCAHKFGLNWEPMGQSIQSLADRAQRSHQLGQHRLNIKSVPWTHRHTPPSESAPTMTIPDGIANPMTLGWLDA